MTGIRESPRKLVEFVCDARPDWDEGDTMVAIAACRTAGFEWARIAGRLVGLALKDETPPTRPGELWDGLRGVKSMPGTGEKPGQSGAGGADYLAAKAAIAAKATGPLFALTPDAERELLREGPDP